MEDEADAASYQENMMRCLREVNVDNNTVGWYQSSTLGSYQTQELIETFVSYHDSIRKCVCIVYDPQRSARGTISLRAIRLRDGFIDLFKEGKVTGVPPAAAHIAASDEFVPGQCACYRASCAQSDMLSIVALCIAWGGDAGGGWWWWQQQQQRQADPPAL